MKIIGIAGIKHSGKSEVAAKIIEMYKDDYYIVKLHFALPIKKILAYFVKEVTDCSEEQSLEYFNDPKLKEKEILEIGATPRLLMTTFGTDFIRQLNSNLWINATNNSIKKLKEIEKTLNKEVIIIIDDIRFENELNFIRQINAKVIFIAREYSTIYPSFFDKLKIQYKVWRKKIHISEKGLYHLKDKNDIIILNDSNLYALWEKIKYLCDFENNGENNVSNAN